MAHRELILALTIIVAASPAFAASQSPTAMTAAPAGTLQTRYCMHIEASTGSRVEPVKCWTRQEWADQGVDIDQEWAKEGLHTIG